MTETDVKQTDVIRRAVCNCETGFLPYEGHISRLLEGRRAELDLPCLVRITSRMSVNHKNKDIVVSNKSSAQYRGLISNSD